MVAAVLPANPSFFERLAGLNQAQRLKVGFGIVVFLAIAIAGLVMGRQAEWRVLYANLAEKDGGAIVAQLAQMNVPYKVADGSGAILVPADKVYDTRLRLASQGLPKGSVTGYELMDTSSRIGMTQFQERLAFQRGLEGELTRSIQSLGSVQAARVHLALPNQNGFFREQQKPSASVLVSLHGGRMLDRSQVAGIVHLVASSVPELDPSAVSVLDDTGKLLSASRDGNATGIDAQQLQYVQQLEQIYSRRIVDLLEPIVGRNNVRAQVTADLDFSLAEQTSETYKPNGAPDSIAIRSQQTLDANNVNAGGNGASGVPGATSNQPPGTANTPVNGSAQNLTTAGTSGNGSARKESTVNYELDKTVRVVRAATPVVKRLTAAVVVNHQSVTDAKGKTSTNPWGDQQVQNMTALVREAIGYSKERNDSVNLMNAPFTSEKVSIDEVPLWKQPQVQDLIHSLAWPVGTLLLAALALVGFVKPALKMLASAPVGVSLPTAVGAQLDAVEAEAPVRPQLDAPRVESALPTPHEIAIEDARRLTRDNPAAVANIVKGWINGEA